MTDVATRIPTLEECFAVIDECESTAQKAWQRMSGAVRSIHDHKLWQQGGHESFEACVEKAYGWSRSHAYRLVQAASVLAVVPVKTLEQAQILGSLPDDRKQKVWEAASQIGDTTAEGLKDALRSVGGESKPKRAPEPPPAPAPEAEDDVPGLLDDPDAPAVPDVAPFDLLMAQLLDARRQMNEIAAAPVGAYLAIEQAKIDMANLLAALRWAKPYGLCPYCNGGDKPCKPCGDRRWVCKGVSDNHLKHTK